MGPPTTTRPPTGTTGSPTGATSLDGTPPQLPRTRGRQKTAQEPATAASISPPPRLRRRPALLAAGVAMVALGGVSAAWLISSVGDTHPVLALAAPVQRGSIIKASDLTVAQVATDPALHPVPAARRADIVGRRAATDLAAGTLLTGAAVASGPTPAAGRSLVGVAVTPAQLPAEPLLAGDTVRVVDTPRAQDDPPAGAPVATSATVVGTHPVQGSAQVVVDVSVPEADAAALAAQVATGRVALVLDSRAR